MANLNELQMAREWTAYEEIENLDIDDAVKQRILTKLTETAKYNDSRLMDAEGQASERLRLLTCYYTVLTDIIRRMPYV